MSTARCEPDEQARRLIAAVDATAAPDFSELEPAEARSAFERSMRILGGTCEDVAEVEDASLPGAAGPRPARVYRPRHRVEAPRQPTVFWLHGGGFVFGSLDSYDRFCRALANRSGCAVVALDYRLAPEHPFPAGLDDCLAAWRALHDGPGERLGVDASRLAIAGDSAGGNLAATLALQAVRGDGPVPRYAVLAYPGVAMDTSSASHGIFGTGYLLTRRTIEWCYRHYTGGRGEADDRRIAALRDADLAGFPRCCVVVAGCDPLRDEAAGFAARLTGAGVDVEVLEYPSTVHGFLIFRAALDVAGEAIDRIGVRLREALDG